MPEGAAKIAGPVAKTRVAEKRAMVITPGRRVLENAARLIDAWRFSIPP